MQDSIIGFIGGGNMATSIIGGLIATGHPAEHILVAEPDQSRRDALAAQYGVTGLADNAELAAQADILVLAVKPNIMGEVLHGIAHPVRVRQPLVISIAAGLPLRFYRDALGAGPALVRAMPNTPALVRAGMTGAILDARDAGAAKRLATTVLAAVGEVRWFETDIELDQVTAVSGSGPAYFFYLMECMQNSAQAMGMDPDVARDLVLHTAAGAAKLALHDTASVAELRARVTSPGGTTAQALQALQDGKLPQVVDNALQAAFNRAAEMSREA